MTPARLEKIEEIFCAALGKEPDKVAQFLDSACEGDEALRRKVESLLTSYQRSDGFIETSAAGVATRIIESGQAELLIGQTFGHYKISKRIGTGGMGEVYLATDIIAGRKAALKLLPTRFTGDPERLKRFQQEAHAVVALNHPNILTVYEIGQDHSTHYIASELIEGETLRERLTRGPMQLSEAVDVAIQVASALVAAHGAGVVHRDIKPENIMLRPDGYVKVLDFGIAKLTESAFAEATADGAESMTLVETNLGSILGTVRYMSPEQACGAPIDKRTDIWSVGAVFYEMITGHVPFIGDPPSVAAATYGAAGTSKEVMSAILEKEPPPLTSYIKQTPVELQQIISKALRKDREGRFRSAHELLDALKGLRHKLEVEADLQRPDAARSWLRWTRSPTALLLGLLVAALALALPLYWNRNPATSSPPEKSIAVLPFENLSGDPDNAYFADGIQEEILTRLAQITDLKVISRSSTQRYQSKPRNLSQIAKQLGVANMLEGSVQRTADQVRVNVQLINAQTDSHLWAETYDRKLTDVFGVESEIAKGIAESLQTKLSGREEQALAVRPTNNPEAYDAYLRGRAFQGRGPFAFGQKAIGYYEQAVQLDPNFALAWASLSRVNANIYFTSGDTEGTPAARSDAVKRALANAQKLQPNSPETKLALGYYQFQVLGDYGLAKTTFRLVSKMVPGSSEGPYALGLIAENEGNWNESVAYFERALTLDPRNVELLKHAAFTYAWLRQFPTALKLYDRALDIIPNDPETMAFKAAVYQAQGNLEQAAKLLSERNAQHPTEIASVGASVTVLRQLRLERNHAEAVRLLKTRLAQFQFDSESDESFAHLNLAFAQYFGGDSAGAKVSAEQARNTLEPLCKSEPNNAMFARLLSLSYAALGNKDSAINEAERAIMLSQSAKDRMEGSRAEENLAVIQAMFGDNKPAISTLGRLLQTPYGSSLCNPMPLTPAFLRLDPFWDPLRGDPAFQKLYEDKAEKSIAVLPFENLSEEKENAFFAAGIHDELLSNLSKIKDLKVISRTSVMQYKSGNARNIREIGQQLGVAHVLEGSVQRSANRVKVSTQLIDARTDSHLWAQTYDRELSDIFSVESEVAKAIADQLRAKLTGQEEQVVAAKPTDNTEAYDSYLRGLAFRQKTTTPATLLAAQEHLREAVRLDPKFAHAWAALSMVDSSGYLTTLLQPTVALCEESRYAAETALTLQPNLGEAVFAKGIYHYGCLKDYDTAIRHLEQARQLLPNDSRVPESLAYVTRRRGQWEQSEKYFNEAERLDPRNVRLFEEHALTYSSLRLFPEALRKVDETLNMTPDDVDTIAVKAAIAQAQGDLPRASALLAPLHPGADQKQALETQVYQAILERSPAPIITKLKEILAKPAPTLGHINAELRFWLGWAQEVAGDYAAAQDTWHQARSELELFFQEQPQNYFLAGNLALANMALGDKAAAISFAEKGMALVPIEKDAVDGTCLFDILARVAAGTGQPDRAIMTLQKLLSMPAQSPIAESVPLTPALLRLDPMFDPLRNDPRFQELVAEKEP